MSEDLEQKQKDDLRSDLKEFSHFILLTVVIGGIVLGIIVGVTLYATQRTAVYDDWAMHDMI